MSGEIVRASTGDLQAPQLPAGLTGDGELLSVAKSRMLTSLDRNSEADMQLFFACQNDSDYNGRDAINRVFPVKHFLLRDVMRTSMTTKELEPCLRLTLIGPDGETFSTTSDICIRSFLLICAVRGYPPWEPVRQLEVVPVKVRGGFTTYKVAEHWPGKSELATKKQRDRKPAE